MGRGRARGVRARRRRRLALTGTPFRSDINPIPFVTYAPGDDGIPRSVADYTYGYAHALADHVVRPVLFMAYSGEMQWRTRAGDEVAARLGEPLTKDLTAQALRTALDPAGAWIPSVLEAADRRLSEVRRHVPDAGGLVIATDQDSARAYAKLLRTISGETPTVVLSDEKAASKKIAKFTDGDSRWMVAVRMVSEGVDVPRLAVGVYATTTSTPLFFAQAVGRFVRARKRGETASVFLPSVPSLLGFASEMEVERDHVLGRRITDEDDIFAAEEDLLAQATAGESASADELDVSFEALGRRRASTGCSTTAASSATPGEVQVGSEEEMDFLGIPGLLEPDQVRELLHSRQSERAATKQRKSADDDVATPQHPRAARACCAASSTASSPPGTTAPASPRHHPRRAAQGVRRARRRGRDRRPAARPDRPDSASGPCASPPPDPPPRAGRALDSPAWRPRPRRRSDRGLHVLRRARRDARPG